MKFSPQSLQNAFLQNYLRNSLLYALVPTKESFEDAAGFLSNTERHDFIAFNDVVTKFNELLDKDPKYVNTDDENIRKIANDYYTLAFQEGLPVNYRVEMFDNLLNYTDKHVHSNKIYASILELISRLTGTNDDAQNRFGKRLYLHSHGLEPNLYFAYMQKIYFRMQDKTKFERVDQLGIFTKLRPQKGKTITIIPAHSSWPTDKRRERLEKIEAVYKDKFWTTEDRIALVGKDKFWTAEERIALAEEALKLFPNNGRSRHVNFHSQLDLHIFLKQEYKNKDETKSDKHLKEQQRWENDIIALDRHTLHPDDLNPNMR